MTFLPEFSALLAFTLAAIVLTVTPGPDMTLFLGRTLAQGRRAGIAAMLGACSGVLVHTTAAAIGLSALVAASPEAFLALKVAGAAYLAWLAFGAIRNGSSFSLDKEAVPPQSFFRNWLTGVGINLLNPKIILFFVTFLPPFVAAGDPYAGQKLFFLGVYFIVIAVPMSIGMIFAADSIAATLKQKPSVMRAIDWVFASVFSAFAVHILLARA
ncbi:threonine transporter RhtB [Aureimonas ureilytica]|uniref:Threonine transporter RhtB n=1 Tax=Aureimonas ureilytica TaxID=401562 RepID=A0A175RV70_9HYPH|nr:LysE family translocator [Aureimonas ureilytica]KTQ85394.1 threonine transporter RhtB [Aureimonas ureilytica]KTR06739.1 threonine transporter RhtB [Aureimonas ureilytica]